MNGWEGGRVKDRVQLPFLIPWAGGGGGGSQVTILHRIYKHFLCLSPDGNCTKLWGFWLGMLGCISERSMCPVADQSNICRAITDSSKRSETRDMQTQRTFQGVRLILLAPYYQKSTMGDEKENKCPIYCMCCSSLNATREPRLYF